MGWNRGYTIMEYTVVTIYDTLAAKGLKLDRELLDPLMEPYRGSDIDQGGARLLTANDGHSVEEIVVLVHDGTLPPPSGDEYVDATWERFDEITSTIYGWG